MKLKLAIDQDQVLADLLTPWLERYNYNYNDNLTTDQITHWSWADIVKPECGKKIYDYLDDAEMFENLPVIKDSQEVVALLAENFDVHIVTSPWNIDNIKPKDKWLRKNFPFLDPKKFVFTGDKSITCSDWLIDDKPENLETFKLSRGRILFDAPHNQTESRFKRMKTWKQISEYFNIN